MRIQQSIFKRGKSGGQAGRVRNAWTLRLTHIDDQEGKTSKTWQFATKQDAKDALEDCKAELVELVEADGLDLGDIKTFRQWADYAKGSFYGPAMIVEGRKVSGIKSHRQTHILIDDLIRCFGDKALSKFSKYDLDHYKTWRLQQGDRRGEQGKREAKERNAVKLSTVNRGLAILKHLLNEAHDAGLIARNVTKGSKAIDADAETARERTLTDAEESLLLAACGQSRTIEYVRQGQTLKAEFDGYNPHLKALILLGLDSGMRRGEILKLEWQDIDFENQTIRILGTHTKTQKNRSVLLSDRTRAELLNLPNIATNGPIFPFNDFKRSWATALRVAGIEGLTFHDLRRTWVTRTQALGISIGLVAELAGHSRIETTQKHYTSIDNAAIIRDVAAKINEANEHRRNHWPETIE